MPSMLDMTYKEFKETGARETEDLRKWERDMRRGGFLKRCKCGNAYTWAHLPEDPKKCAACRDDEGELLL